MVVKNIHLISISLFLNFLFVASFGHAAILTAEAILPSGSKLYSDDKGMLLTFGAGGLSVTKTGTYDIYKPAGSIEMYDKIWLPNGVYCNYLTGDRGTVRAIYSCPYPAQAIPLTGVPGIKLTQPSVWKLQSDGNLVLYNKENQAVKHTATGGKTNSYLEFSNDGSLKIHSPSPKVSWHTATSTANYIASSNPSIGTLEPGKILKVNQFVHSGNETYRLIMQSDGNLVLYNVPEGRALWASYTVGAGNWAVMQTDGNLVVYSASNKPLWNSGTAGKPSSYASIQDDGNFVIYTPLLPTWSSKTATNSFVTSSTGSGIIAPGRRLYAGDAVNSGNGTYSLIMQGDGNLVLYNVVKGIPLWATYTTGTGIKAKMQGDGNFIVTDDADTKALFATWTHKYPSSFGAVQDDGNFVIYSPYMAISWKTSAYQNGNTPSSSNPPNNYYEICPSGAALVQEGRDCPFQWTISTGGIECAVNYLGNVNNCVNDAIKYLGW